MAHAARNTPPSPKKPPHRTNRPGPNPGNPTPTAGEHKSPTASSAAKQELQFCRGTHSLLTTVSTVPVTSITRWDESHARKHPRCSRPPDTPGHILLVQLIEKSGARRGPGIIASTEEVGGKTVLPVVRAEQCGQVSRVRTGSASGNLFGRISIVGGRD